MNSFLRKLTWFTQRNKKEADLRDELQFHLDEETGQHQASGLAPEHAQRAARADLGNLTLTQEDTRAAWSWMWMEQLAQDVRYSFRTMASNRLFTFLSVLSLALGIGANTAIYSFMDAILLRSLPVSDPESLVVLNWHAKTNGRDPAIMHAMSGTTYEDGKSGIQAGIFPFPAFEWFQTKDPLFSNVFAYFQSRRARKLNVTVHGQADLASGHYVSGGYFPGLGISPAAGRLLTPDDDHPGGPPVVVVSHTFSQQRFGGPANAVGQSILINNLPFTVLGVAPPEFFGVESAFVPDLYLPLHANELLSAADAFGFRSAQYLEPNYYWIQVMARLRPGVTMEQAQAALAPAFQQWVATTASTDKERADLPQLIVVPGAGGLDTLRRRYSQPLYVLMTLVGLILALACANVANLLLARAASRRREMALRLSVGAGRFRVIRQLLTESVLLAALGGLFGILFAIWGIRFLTLLLANGETSTLHAELNWRVLAAAAALSLLTGVLFGLAPALQATRVDVISTLKETRAGRLGGRHFIKGLSLSHVLVVSQITISLLMLVAAGLFGRTLSNLQSIELGFNRENVLLFQLDARQAGLQSQEIAPFYTDVRKRLTAIPGVRNASLSDSSLIGAGFGLPVNVAGQPRDPANRILTIGPAFFATMQIPIRMGREIDERDRAGSLPVVVINEVFAKKNFGDRSPIGQHVFLSNSGRGQAKGASTLGRDMEIVGVSRNARYGGIKREINPVIYIPFDQGYPDPNEMVYELRTSGDPLSYVKSVREIVAQTDPRVPVSDIKTQAADIDQTISQEIMFAKLCSGLAMLALVIACVGLYGTISYNVARRTSEIGIRVALGAQRRGVAWMVLREVLILTMMAVAIGLPTAIGASRLAESFLYGLKPTDPLTLAAAMVLLLCAALLAGYLPARRAARIDPVTALRHE